eukprot:scaffold1619_cov121-Isochrysis_galbana.AAC.8
MRPAGASGRRPGCRVRVCALHAAAVKATQQPETERCSLSRAQRPSRYSSASGASAASHVP